MLGYALGGAARGFARHRTELEEIDLRGHAAALRDAVGIELNSPTTVRALPSDPEPEAACGVQC